MRKLGLIAIAALVFAAPANAARISARERAEINRTIDGFVNHAVKRQTVDQAWNLVTPQMKAGISRASWDKGNVPTTPYDAGGTRFHEWTVVFSSPHEVDFNLMVPARGKADSIQFNGTMKKVGGRWLIDSFEPSATFGGGAVAGPHDYTAGAGGDGGGVATLGKGWIAIPIAVFLVGLVGVVGWFVYGLYKNRRAYRRYDHRPLEPLPTRGRNGGDPAQTPAASRKN